MWRTGSHHSLRGLPMPRTRTECRKYSAGPTELAAVSLIKGAGSFKPSARFQNGGPVVPDDSGDSPDLRTVPSQHWEVSPKLRAVSPNSSGGSPAFAVVSPDHPAG